MSRLLHPLTLALCALALLGPTTARQAAATSGPTISASLSPATLPVTGGVVTITATVTDPGGGTITGVSASVPGVGGVNLYNGGSGSTYTGTFGVGKNVSDAPYQYTATVSATDSFNLSSNATTSNQVTEANDATPPTITGAALSPSTLPVTGGVVTITATVADPNSRAITGVSASVPGVGGVTLSNGGSSSTYTGTFSVGKDTSDGQYVYTATVSATNDLGLSNTATASSTTQSNDATPPTISASLSPSTLPVTGGVVAITAIVTDPHSRAITGVSASVPGVGGVTLSNGGSGSTYTGTFGVGKDTSDAPYQYTATVSATDDLGLSNTATAGNQVTEANDAAPPTITNATLNPATLPATGGTVTITATVTDPNSRAITGVSANVNGVGGVTLSSGGSGNIYTGHFGVGNNSGPYNFTGTVTATNDLGLSDTATLNGTQGTGGGGTSNPPTLSTPNPANPVLSPPVVAAGGPSFPLTITGSGFPAGATVLFNGVTLTPTGVTPSQITVTIPAALVVNPGSYAVTVTAPGGFSNGVNLIVAAAAPPVPLYALSYQGTYFFLTASASQEASLLANGWVGGPTGHVYANATDAPGTTPLFQLYEPNGQDHFYTTDPNQRASLIASGSWQDKGISCYVYAGQESGTVPLYKAFNTATNQHQFTANAAQYNALTAPWGKYGPAAYILP